MPEFLVEVVHANGIAGFAGRGTEIGNDLQVLPNTGAIPKEKMNLHTGCLARQIKVKLRRFVYNIHIWF
jgi:hypothetical protein